MAFDFVSIHFERGGKTISPRLRQIPWSGPENNIILSLFLQWVLKLDSSFIKYSQQQTTYMRACLLQLSRSKEKEKDVLDIYDLLLMQKQRRLALLQLSGYQIAMCMQVPYSTMSQQLQRSQLVRSQLSWQRKLSAQQSSYSRTSIESSCIYVLLQSLDKHKCKVKLQLSRTHICSYYSKSLINSQLKKVDMYISSTYVISFMQTQEMIQSTQRSIVCTKKKYVTLH